MSDPSGPADAQDSHGVAGRIGVAALCLLAALALSPSAQQRSPGVREWRVYGGDAAATRYSSLRDINRSNVAALAVAWTWRPDERALKEYGTEPGTFQTTPLMIDGVLYASTPYNRVVALDPLAAERAR